jgi:hypothetical protein
MNVKKIVVALSIFFASMTCAQAADLDVDVDLKYVSGSNPKQDIVQKSGEWHGKDMAYDDLTHLNDLITESKVMSAKDSDFQVVANAPSYEISVTQSGATRHFKWSPGHAPRDIKPLVQYLENRTQKTVTKAKKGD